MLCDAFAAYPTMRYVLGAEAPDYERKLSALIGFFVTARVMRDEPILAVADETGAPAACAILTRPGGRAHPAELIELRERLWARLGHEARARYDAFGEACGDFEVEAPHYHLNMIGVGGAARGRGLAGVLLDEIHRLSAEDPGSSGVTLSTEDPANVGLYERFGYRLLGHVRVGPSLESWGFFRPDDAGSGV